MQPDDFFIELEDLLQALRVDPLPVKVVMLDEQSKHVVDELSRRTAHRAEQEAAKAAQDEEDDLQPAKDCI